MSRRYSYRKNYTWNGELAYLAGLFASDGCLLNDGRHLAMTSRDADIIKSVQSIASVTAKPRQKTGPFGTKAYHLQFSDVALYDLLLGVGLTSAKSKTIGKLDIPELLYADFLRGYFDGDGTVYGYKDPRWPNSYMYYTSFVSASMPLLKWLQSMNQRLILVNSGNIKTNVRAYTLSYAKADSQRIFSAMYRGGNTPRSARKHSIFMRFLSRDPYVKIAVDARVLESVDRLA